MFRFNAETCRGVALRIEINNQDALADGSQSGAKIDSCRGLTDAALLIGKSLDTRAPRYTVGFQRRIV